MILFDKECWLLLPWKRRWQRSYTVPFTGILLKLLSLVLFQPKRSNNKSVQPREKSTKSHWRGIAHVVLTCISQSKGYIYKYICEEMPQSSLLLSFCDLYQDIGHRCCFWKGPLLVNFDATAVVFWLFSTNLVSLGRVGYCSCGRLV